MRWIAGVDGCPGGWLAAFRNLEDPSVVDVRVEASFGAIVDAPEEPVVVAVDMPIGLPDRVEAGGRTPERLCRLMLDRARHSVFPTSAREVVYAGDYTAAIATARALAQPFLPSPVSNALFPRIIQIDQLLRARSVLLERVVEVHPEIAFFAMNGDRALTGSKKTDVGLKQRADLLIANGLPSAAAEARPPRGAKRDDLLDALAAVVVAERVFAKQARSIPDPPERDSHGLPIAIWTCAAPRPAGNSAAPSPLPITRQDIAVAHARIAGHIRRTPVFDLPRGAFGLSNRLSLKLELLQHAGSFKPRGAFNTLLSRPLPALGVAAASGGNHGAAVAYAAKTLGVKARIFVPEIASSAKVAAIRSFGAEIVIGGQRYADAQEACDRFVAETGALRVHPFDAEATIAGQGTVAREWEGQTDQLDTVLVAVGGGGLVAGMAAWWHGAPVKVVGVEPEGSRALHAALVAGGPVDVPVESVAADSLGARNVGPLIHAIAAVAVDHVALVPDESIAAAQCALWRDYRIAGEPGGAAALAALLSGAYKPAEGERVGVLLCGGNVDLVKLAALAG